jgi:hypothetical protein
MLNNKVVKPGTVLSVCLVSLTVVFGITSCGSKVGDDTGSPPGSPQVKTTVHAFATPSLVNYGDSARITWTSTDSNSCSTSPTSKIATGTGIGIAGEFTTTALTENTTFTISCTGDTGTRDQPVTVSVGSTSVHAAAACTPYPPLSGTTYYYCDCGTGADSNCSSFIGDDANPGTDIAHPRRTLANAMTRFNSMAANETVALCRGGAFDTTVAFSIGASRCSAGSTCNDLREYLPTGSTSTAKPVINSTGTANTFNVSGIRGGVRLLHLSLKGNGTNKAFFYYEGAHDVTMCDLDMDNFAMAVYIEAGKPPNVIPNNITLTGSNITNSTMLGYLGGGNNTVISYNNWEGNGSNNALNHTLYFAAGTEVANVTAVGNYIHGQYGPTCLGAAVEGHGAFNGFLFKNNHISIDADKAGQGCWGIELNNGTGNPDPTYFQNMVVSGNTIINGGNTGVTISTAPGLILENNIIIQNWAAGGAIGMSIPGRPKRAQDLTSTANVIRNNTIWFGPNATGTNTGIATNTEGTDHVVSNNTVSSAQTTGSLNCYRHDLPLSSYAFINNNHCYSSTVSNRWETTRGTLAAWQAYSTTRGFDSASITGADPMFTTAGTNFRPVGGPLVGHGSNDPRYMSERDITDTLRPVAPAQPAIGAFEP